MTMNNRDVKSVFVKLIAGLLMVLMLVSIAVPVAFAQEESEQTETTEQTTEAETESEESDQKESVAKLTTEQIEAIAKMIAGNDAARQLFLAAYGYNQDGICYKYTVSYFNEKGDFAIDSTVAGMENFQPFGEEGTWESLTDDQRTEVNAYVIKMLEDLKKASGTEIVLPTELTKGYEDEEKTVNGDVEAIVDKMAKEDAVDLENKGNFLDAILRGVGFVLNWATKYLTFGTNNYLLSLLYFAIAIEILMIPFAIAQQKNSIKQAKLRPKEMAIRKRYAGRNDQATMQKVNQEIQELYQREHFSPLSGCLPLLIQLPVVMALYYVVIDPVFYVLGCAKEFSSALVTYYTTSPAAGGLGGTLGSERGTIEILSKINAEGIEGLADFALFSNAAECAETLQEIVTAGLPSFNIGSWNFGLTPWSSVTGGMANFASNWWLLLVPVLTFAVYFASMKLNRKLTYQPTTAENDKATGCSNNMMDFMMPLMSVYIAFIVPAAVGVYWMFKSVLGTIKQVIMKKAMPIPVFTEEDYKAAEKELYGKNPPKAPKASGTRNPNVRSLHHIDDDEYDEKGNFIGRKEEPVKEEQTEKKNQKAPAMAEPLKDESDKNQKNDSAEDENTNS